MDECKGCYFNRPMKAWGETFQACFYTLEMERDIRTSSADDRCGGYEEVDKQIEMKL
jgi:hypothetical protein